jgi:hypothetical protein
MARWLAPAAACGLVALAGLGPERFGGNLPAPESGALFAAAMSNPTQAAYLGGAFHSEHNAVGRETLEWTVRPASTSTIPSFRVFRTNALLP